MRLADRFPADRYPQCLCDFRQIDEYTDHGKSAEHWAWEFIRRNPEFQRHTDVLKVAKERWVDLSEPDLQDAQYSHFWLLGLYHRWLRHWRDEHDIPSSLRDPFRYRAREGRWPLMRHLPASMYPIGKGKDIQPLNPNTVIIEISLEYSLHEQFQIAQSMAREIQAEAKAKGVISQPINAPRLPGDQGVPMLRILDAQAESPKPSGSEVMRALNRDPITYRSRFNKVLKQAMTLRDGEARNLTDGHQPASCNSDD